MHPVAILREHLPSAQYFELRDLHKVNSTSEMLVYAYTHTTAVNHGIVGNCVIISCASFHTF